jgi:hypothetical protein
MPKVIGGIEQAVEINRLTSRHIAKLFKHLESKNIIFSDFEQSAIKTQFRQLQDDIINFVGGVENDNELDR